MSDDLAEPHFQRGLLLMEQRRYGDAADYFRQALAHNPHDAQTYRNLALCQLHLPTGKEQALQTIRQALEFEPNDAGTHAVYAHVLCVLERYREALAAARQAVSLDPYLVFAINMETQSQLGLQQWAEAESAARRALALDPDDQTAANQLAHALRLQNKMAENADQVAWLLERDPEDPDTHCTAGWAALQRGEFRVAEHHFLEALRLDPEMENAREGVLESFRARSPLYRAYLAYSFRMGRLSQNARWAVIIGLYLGVKFSRSLFTGPYAPVAKVLGFLYLVFVLWVWIARGLGNFILLLDRFASHALRRNEKIEAGFVGGSLCAALLFILLSLFMHSSTLLLVGASFLAAAIPFSLTFTNRSTTGKWLFGSIGSICLLSGVALALKTLLPGVIPPELPALLLAVGIGGAVLTTWIGNIPALRR